MKNFWQLLLFITHALFSQEVPPIQNFQTKDYNGENQSWSISQSPTELIYIANNKGLLEYNGANWKTYPSPNESILRSVKVVNDRIYTGCFMEFGFWKKNELGILNYTSLSNKIKLIDDEQFWNILAIDKWVVFQSLKCIYIYDTEQKTYNQIPSKNAITKIFEVDNTIYFQKVEEGIFKIDSGKEVLISDREVLKNDKVIAIFKEDKKLLLLTKSNGFYTLDNNSLIKKESLADDLLSQISAYSCIQLRNKDIVIGSISNGLIHLSSKGKFKYQINQNKGLLNNTILSLYEDQENNIWMGLDNGISYINSNSNSKVYNDEKGILGSVYTSIIHKNYMYLGTNQGLFYKENNTDQEFTLIKGTEGQVWSLDIIDNTLFCGHDSGTFIIEKGISTKIATIQGTWSIKKTGTNSQLLLQGNYDGLYLLVKQDNTWKLRNKIEGFNHSARYFELFDNQIFINHEYKGVFKLKIDESFSKVNNTVLDTSLKGANSSIVKYNNDLLYAYKKGVFKYDIHQQKFVKDKILSSTYSEDEYESGKLILDNENNILWIFSNSKLSYISPSSLSGNLKINNIPFSKEKRKGILGYENIIPLNKKGDYLIGTTSGYIIININNIKNQKFEVKIDQIKNNNQNISLPKKEAITVFETKNNNLEFSYFVSKYNKLLNTQYQFQLKGIYDDWSTWTDRSNIKFENLPYGEYTFNIKAKIGDTLSKNTISYAFKIKKPWYISNLMLSLYAISVILFSIFMHTIYRQYYKRQQKKIIAQNKQELELTQVQSEKEIIKIKNQQLEIENKSKSKELAASTMGMIRKNELLSTIKNELNQIKDKNSVKSVIKIIDHNLNQNDDWLLFQEAFNNADSDFLKNIKKSHPSLSPSDLKLCAYLRLNLSSKEMAQLFNISPRSVEIKRYRLRKKLNLQHEDNLVNYILEL